MWAIPEYIKLFDQDLTAAQAWIATGGTATTVGPVDVQPASDGEAEADDWDEELVPASRRVPKAQKDDQKRYALDRGAWADSPVARQGDQLYIQVSSSL